jgi:hypothetical protein
VAFQHVPGAENVGYVIPTPIVQHFLTDIERHGQFTGFCRCVSRESGAKCSSIIRVETGTAFIEPGFSSLES